MSQISERLLVQAHLDAKAPAPLSDAEKADYKARMKEGQDAIYYITADSLTAARNSPQLEVFRKKGIEVLLLHDRIDEWLMSHLTEFDGKSFADVAKGNLELDDMADEAEKIKENCCMITDEDTLEYFLLIDTCALLTTDDIDYLKSVDERLCRHLKVASLKPEVKLSPTIADWTEREKRDFNEMILDTAELCATAASATPTRTGKLRKAFRETDVGGSRLRDELMKEVKHTTTPSKWPRGTSALQLSKGSPMASSSSFWASVERGDKATASTAFCHRSSSLSISS